MSNQTGGAKEQEVNTDISAVVGWEPAGGELEHGVDSDEQWTGWIRGVGSLKAYNTFTKERTTFID